MTHIEELQEVQEMLRRSNSLLSFLHEWLKMQIEELSGGDVCRYHDLLKSARILVTDSDFEIASMIRRLAKE